MCAQRVYLIPQEAQHSPPTVRKILEQLPIAQREAAEHVLQTIQNDLRLNDDGQVLYTDAADSTNVPGSYVWDLLHWYLLKSDASTVAVTNVKKPPDFPLFEKLLETHDIGDDNKKKESLQTRSTGVKPLHFPKSWLRLYDK